MRNLFSRIKQKLENIVYDKKIYHTIDCEPQSMLTPEAKERLLDAYGMDELLGITRRFIARKVAA